MKHRRKLYRRRSIIIVIFFLKFIFLLLFHFSVFFYIFLGFFWTFFFWNLLYFWLLWARASFSCHIRVIWGHAASYPRHIRVISCHSLVKNAPENDRQKSDTEKIKQFNGINTKSQIIQTIRKKNWNNYGRKRGIRPPFWLEGQALKRERYKYILYICMCLYIIEIRIEMKVNDSCSKRNWQVNFRICGHCCGNLTTDSTPQGSKTLRNHPFPGIIVDWIQSTSWRHLIGVFFFLLFFSFSGVIGGGRRRRRRRRRRELNSFLNFLNFLNFIRLNSFFFEVSINHEINPAHKEK